MLLYWQSPKYIATGAVYLGQKALVQLGKENPFCDPAELWTGAAERICSFLKKNQHGCKP